MNYSIATTNRKISAQKAIAVAMGAVIPLWFIPFVSGPICNEAESAMIESILKHYNKYAKENANNIFWFFRKKYLFLNCATYVPFVGTALQLIEVYALGQLTMSCMEEGIDVNNEDNMTFVWDNIRQNVWSGYNIVVFYEEFSGNIFPESMKSKFISIADVICGKLRNNNSDISDLQEHIGESVRVTIAKTKRTISNLFK